MSEIVYEQCKHEWETLEKSREFIGRAGNAFIGGFDHFKLVWLQKCKICHKINKVS